MPSITISRPTSRTLCERDMPPRTRPVRRQEAVGAENGHVHVAVLLLVEAEDAAEGVAGAEVGPRGVVLAAEFTRSEDDSLGGRVVAEAAAVAPAGHVHRAAEVVAEDAGHHGVLG